MKKKATDCSIKGKEMKKKILSLVFGVVVILLWAVLCHLHREELKEKQKHWTERDWDEYTEHMENRPFR